MPTKHPSDRHPHGLGIEHHANSPPDSPLSSHPAQTPQHHHLRAHTAVSDSSTLSAGSATQHLAESPLSSQDRREKQLEREEEREVVDAETDAIESRSPHHHQQHTHTTTESTTSSGRTTRFASQVDLLPPSATFSSRAGQDECEAHHNLSSSTFDSRTPTQATYPPSAHAQPQLQPAFSPNTHHPNSPYNRTASEPFPTPSRPPHSRASSSTWSDIEDGASTVGGSMFDEDVLYDWSDEEDLVDADRKLKQKMGLAKGDEKKKGWGFKRVITLLFSSLLGSTLLSAILVTPPLIVHYYYEKPNPTEHRRYVSDNIGAWFYLAAFNVLVSWYLACLVDLSPVVMSGLLLIIWGETTEGFKTGLETFRGIQRHIKPVLYAASIWGSWAIIMGPVFGLYDPNDSAHSRAVYTDRLYDVVQLLFFIVLIYCLEKILLQLIAMSFHRTAYKDRLDTIQHTTAVLDQLNLYRPKKSRTSGSGNHSSLVRPAATSQHITDPSFFTRPSTPSGLSAPSSTPNDSGSHQQHQYSTSSLFPPPSTQAVTASSDALIDRKDGDEKERVGFWARTFGRGRSRKEEGGVASESEAEAGTLGSGLVQTPRSMSLQHEAHIDSNNACPVGRQARSDSNSTSATLIGLSSPYAKTTKSLSPQPTSSEHHEHSRHQHHYESPAQSHGSASPMFGNEHKARARKIAKGVGRIVLHDARNVRGVLPGEKKKKSALDDYDEEEGEGGVAGLGYEVGSARVAKRLARSIYTSYKKDPKRSYLIPSDFEPAFPTSKAAEDAFGVFDKDGNGDISKSEIKTVVSSVYQDRRILAKSMQDIGSAVSSLDSILMAIGCIILFFISLSIFNVKLGSQITSLYTIALGLSFIFKSAASSAFDSVIFIFVTTPFNTGDRIFLGDEVLVVKKMGIFSTTFSRTDGVESYYYNSVLSGMKITNVRRSGPMPEAVALNVSYYTPMEKLDALEKAICNWLSTEEKRDLASSTSIAWQKIEFQTSIALTIGIPHCSNWQNWGERWARRTKFHAAVKYYAEKLQIECQNSLAPYSFTRPAPEYDARSPAARAPPSAPSPSASANAHPTKPSAIDQTSPYHPSSTSSRTRKTSTQAAGADVSGETILEPVRATLGFLPPANERGGVSTVRRRKVRRGREAKMMGVDTADGGAA